ncbi:MAG TPA: hydroxymethylbilane synthase, partial [Dehalococcoidia bacterium]|nr:hydroxymethylbilane synthase [Dehalococcoidia bacterium]
MVSSKVIKVGSRGSNLALYQTNHVIGRLRQIYPDREFEVVTVRTQGDINTESSLEGMGLGVFVNEIERL